MSVKIIVDPGSCHLGDEGRAYDFVNRSVEVGADAIKFQLFKEEAPFVPPNIMLPWSLFPKLVEHGQLIGIEVFASFFHWDAFQAIKDAGCKSIKFAYGMRGQVYEYAIKKELDSFENVYVSYGFMDTLHQVEGLTHLWCIPEYPVPYQVDFTQTFYFDITMVHNKHSAGVIV